MAIPFIDLSNVVKWFSGFGSGTPSDPYGLTVGGNLIAVSVEITRPTDTSPYSIGDVSATARAQQPCRQLPTPRGWQRLHCGHSCFD